MSPETLAGLAIGWMLILFTGATVNHVLSVREYERRRS